MSIIAFDLDDTLAQTCEAVLAQINSILNAQYTIDQMTSTKWEEVIPEVNFPLIKGIFESGIFRNLLPVEGAVDYVNNLHAQGHELHIITDRYWNESDMQDTIDWLANHNFPAMKVHLCKSNAKAALAKELGVTLFYEDRTSNANAIAEVCEVRLRTIANNANDVVVANVVRYTNY